MKSSQLPNKPDKVYYKRELNDSIYGYRNYSAIVWFLIPFTLLWGGGSLGGIYLTQYFSGKFEFIPSAFGIPFLIGTLFLIRAIVRMLFGKTELRLNAKGGSISKGALIKKQTHFFWSEINIVESDHALANKLASSPKYEALLSSLKSKTTEIIKCRGKEIAEFSYAYSKHAIFLKEIFIENYNKHKNYRY